MDSPRLQFIAQFNPLWAQRILDFVENNLEFYAVLDIAPATEYPMGFNKNPGEPFNPTAPMTIFEHLVYYIAHAGVNTVYGKAQYLSMLPEMRRTTNPSEITFANVQPKKVQTYIDLLTWLVKNNLATDQMTVDHVKSLQISGLGIGAKNHINKFFNATNTIEVCDVTDRGFIGGFSKLYRMDVQSTSGKSKTSLPTLATMRPIIEG